MKAYRARLMGAAALIALSASVAHAQDQGTPPSTQPGDHQSAAEIQTDGALNQTPTADDAPSQSSSDQPAQAEQPPGEIVVTGVRAALEKAERVKRDSAVVIDGFSADDIGALPDASIAESLARIPGLTSNDRENGFEQLSIRGLGPDLALVTYNGRTFPAPTLGDRRVNLGDIPTEGVSFGAVQKTTDAASIQGGASGTIFINAFRPLETTRRGLTIVARGVYQDISNKTAGPYGAHPLGFRTEVSYIQRLAHNLGIAIDYAYVRRTNASPSVQLDVPSVGTTTRADLNADGRPDLITNNVGVRNAFSNQSRHSVIGTLQWDPAPDLRLTVDGLYMNDGGTRNTERFFAFGTQNGVNGAPTSAVLTDNVLTQFAGQVSGYREILNNNIQRQQQKEVGFNAAYDGPIKIKLDLSWAQAAQNGINRQITTENDAANTAGQRLPFAYDIRDTANPSFTFQSLAPEDYALTNLLYQRVDATDTIKAGRLDFDVPVSMPLIQDLAFGVFYQDRIKRSTPDDTQYNWAGATPAAFANRPDLDSAYLNVPSNPLVNQSRYVGGPSAANFPVFDFDKVYALRTAAGVTASDQLASDIANRYRFDEASYALYMQANLKAGPVTGNAGLRYVITDNHIDGFFVPLPASEATKVSNRFYQSVSYALPTLNLKYAITPTLAARFAYGRTISPPTFGSQRIGFSYDPSAANSVVNVTIGNPQLLPFTSDNLDASLEWYPDKSTALVLQSFSKFVHNFITPITFAGPYTLPNGVALAQAQVTTSINDPETRHFRGFELIGRRDFDFLPGILSHFGASADWVHNFDTDAYANITVAGGGSLDVAPNGFTGDVVNSQLYFDTKTVDFRLVYRYYSSYLRLADNGFQSQPTGRFDFSANVQVRRGVNVVLIATNLMNTPSYETFVNPYDRSSNAALRNTIYDGRRVTAGVRLQF